MPVINKSQLSPLIDSLSEQLQQLRLWSVEIPPVEHLLSQQPFCCDCLALEAWLQFVFIPKIQKMLNGNPLTCFECGIYPVAEESFNWVSNDISSLMNVIKNIDEIISGRT